MSELTITRKTIDNSLERKLVINCITNSQVLSAISRIWKAEYAKAPYSAKVLNWCIDYFNTFGNAPGKQITDIYIAHKHTMDDSLADPIGSFLHSLDKEYDESGNTPFLVDQAQHYVRLRSVETFQAKLSLAVENKDVVEAERLVGSFSRIEVTSSSTTNLHDLSHNELKEAFSPEESSLFDLPGALGMLIGSPRRTDFINILAPSKTAKSFLTSNWIGIYAMIQGCNVLQIQLEMQQGEVQRRFYQALNASPKYDKNVKLNYFYKDEEEDKWKIGEKEEHRKVVDYSPEKVKDFWHLFRSMYPRAGKYKLHCGVSKSMTVKDIRSMLINMEQFDGFVPDVIILDRPLLLRYGGSGADDWKAVGDVFAELRGLATETQSCIVASSHTNRGGYSANALDHNHTGKSIEILENVTCAVGLMSTAEERERGIMRAKQLVTRDGRVISDQAIILQALDLALPHTDSRMLSETDYTPPKGKDEKEE